jgi:hypothetical protein
MTMRIGSSSHIGEADLIRYMDHQMDRDGLRRARTHLAVCSVCTERLAELQQRSSAVSAWIADLPADAPDPGKRALALATLERTRVRRSATGPLDRRVLLRAAAIVAVAFGGLMATRPGRATLADGIRRVAGDDLPGMLEPWVERWDTDPLAAHAPAAAPTRVEMPHVHGEPAADAAPETPRAVVRSGSLPRGMSPPVTFVPEGPDVTLAFESLQRQGAATVWFRDVPEATGQVVAGRRGETLQPNPQGLDIRNRSGSQADYVITVPARFRFLRVRVGDGPEMVIPIARAKKEWVWTITLQASDTPPPAEEAADEGEPQ